MVRHAELVIAFEPSPDVFPRLAKNVEISGLNNVRIVNAALGEKAGVLSFSEGRMSVNCRVSESGGLKVPCVTLDGQLSNIPGIDLLKIDTEGYETHVLQGASETLKKTVESHWNFIIPGKLWRLNRSCFRSDSHCGKGEVIWCSTPGAIRTRGCKGWECFFCRSIRIPHRGTLANGA